MKKILSLVFLLTPFLLLAQSNDSTVNLDILRAPSSPAFNLLGISPSAIERPTDVNAFKLSIQNATNNFTKLPSDYAVEIAPASLTKMPNQTLDKFNSTKFKDYFWQSLSISLGLSHGNADDMETNDSTSFTKLGAGIKFSLIRPRWSDKTKAMLEELEHEQKAFLDSAYTYSRRKELDSLKDVMRRTPSDVVLKRIGYLDSVINAAINSPLRYDSTRFTALKAAARNFKIDRVGAFLDFAGGIALDFPDNNFNYSITNKAGAWLTGGYENGNKGFSALAIARYLYQPDKIFADDSNRLKKTNISTFDAGARLIYTAMQGKLSVSTEALYRSVLNSGVISPNWRFTFNTEYDIGFNKKLTFAFGKNFDGTITKGGNIIALLNLVAGFGSSKTITAK